MSLAKLLTFYFLIFKPILIKHQEHWLYLFHEMTCKSHISLKYWIQLLHKEKSCLGFCFKLAFR